MRSRLLGAILLPLPLLLSQCKPRDPTPPVPKVDSPAMPSEAPGTAASPQTAPGERQTGR